MAVLIIIALVPLERAHAVVISDCGQWYTPGGFLPTLPTSDFYPFLDGHQGICEFDLTYTTQSPNQPVDLVFGQNSGPGSYIFTSYVGGNPDSVNNHTGIDWNDYHLELGFGNVFSGNWTPASSSSLQFGQVIDLTAFGSVTQSSPHMIDFYQGTVQSTGSFNFGVVVLWDGTTGPFTLRQYYTTSSVPVPATLFLMGLGLAGLCYSHRKRV